MTSQSHSIERYATFRAPFNDKEQVPAYTSGDGMWFLDMNYDDANSRHSKTPGCWVYYEDNSCYSHYIKNGDGIWFDCDNAVWDEFRVGDGRWYRYHPPTPFPLSGDGLPAQLNRRVLTSRWELEVSLSHRVKNVIVNITGSLMVRDISDIITAYAEPVHPDNRLDIDYSELLRETS